MGFLKSAASLLRIRVLTAEETGSALYNATMNRLAQGNVHAARNGLQALNVLSTAGHPRSLYQEAEIWCLLCEGNPSAARNAAATVTTSSPLLLAVLGVVTGTSEGAVEALADGLRATPSFDLVTHALVACGASHHLAALLERPGMVTRFSDVSLQASTARVFHTGAYDACERMCITAFRAYGSPVHLFNAACCAARRGDIDGGLTHVKNALGAGWSDRAHLARDPDLANLRADPRFSDVR